MTSWNWCQKCHLFHRIFNQGFIHGSARNKTTRLSFAIQWIISNKPPPSFQRKKAIMSTPLPPISPPFPLFRRNQINKIKTAWHSMWTNPVQFIHVLEVRVCFCSPAAWRFNLPFWLGCHCTISWVSIASHKWIKFWKITCTTRIVSLKLPY